MNLNTWLDYTVSIYIIHIQYTRSKHEIHFHNVMVKTPPLVSDGINVILLPPIYVGLKRRGRRGGGGGGWGMGMGEGGMESL